MKSLTRYTAVKLFIGTEIGDLEQRNKRCLTLFQRNRYSFGANYVSVVLRQKSRPMALNVGAVLFQLNHFSLFVFLIALNPTVSIFHRTARLACCYISK